MSERVEEIRRQLVRAMTDLGWSQADADEWDAMPRRSCVKRGRRWSG